MVQGPVGSRFSLTATFFLLELPAVYCDDRFKGFCALSVPCAAHTVLLLQAFRLVGFVLFFASPVIISVGFTSISGHSWLTHCVSVQPVQVCSLWTGRTHGCPPAEA